MTDLFEHALALDGELADAGSAGQSGARDVALEAMQIELERLELELCGSRLEASGGDHVQPCNTGRTVLEGGENAPRAGHAERVAAAAMHFAMAEHGRPTLARRRLRGRNDG